MKKNIVLILFFHISGFALAQQDNCYTRGLKTGENLFNNKDYINAKKVFETTKDPDDCPDIKNNKNGIKILNNWINKCNIELKKIKEADEKAAIKQLKLLFTTDYPCNLFINHKKQTSLKIEESKEITITYKNLKDTFFILASSIPENIPFRQRITASDFQNGGNIQIELKKWIPIKKTVEEKIEPEITLEISLSNLDFENTDGTITVKVNTNADNYWIVDSTLPKYCTIVEKQNSFFDVKCDYNPNPEERSAWFIVKAGTKEKRIDIKQKASPVFLTISSKDNLFKDSGGMETIAIKTNAKNFKINRIDTFEIEWVNIYKVTADSFKMECENNPSVESRTTKYSIIAGNIEDTIIIKQEGKPIINKIYPNNIVFDFKGGTRAINVATTTGEYNIGTSTKWFQAMNKDKTGFIVNCEPYTRKEIRYARTDRKLKKNLTRYDTIIVSVKDSIQKVSVAQKAPAMALKIPYNTVGFTFAYVQKNWDYQIPTSADSLDREIWKSFNKMHGFQVGLRIDPYFASSLFGLGISIGVYYQYAVFKNGATKNFEKSSIIEHSLYFPIHLIYRYDFTKTVGIFINGGLAIDLSLSIVENAIDKPSYRIYIEKGWEIGSKTAFTGELGGGIKLGRFIFYITSSVGASSEENSDSDPNTDIFKIIPRHRMRAGLTLMLQ